MTRFSSAKSASAAMAAILVLTGCSATKAGTDPPLPGDTSQSSSSSAQGLGPESSIEKLWWQMDSTGATTETTSSPSASPRSQHYVFNGDVLFEADSPVLSAAAGGQLEVLLPTLQSHPNVRVTVDGHTNNVPGSSEEEAVRLSAARAESVKAWFTERGIDPNRITARGLGDSHPVYPSDTDVHRSANRRCEITLEEAQA